MKPGAIGLVPISGFGGIGIKLGELLLDGRCGVQHAFVLLDDGTVLEAEPDGARIVAFNDEYSNVRVRWLDRPLSDEARATIVRIARNKVGVRYNWWSYIWLALNKFGMHFKWIRKRMDNPNNSMCSQLADDIWREAAEQVTDPTDQKLLKLFNDNRDPGSVTPGDLLAIA